VSEVVNFQLCSGWLIGVDAGGDVRRRSSNRFQNIFHRWHGSATRRLAPRLAVVLSTAWHLRRACRAGCESPWYNSDHLVTVIQCWYGGAGHFGHTTRHFGTTKSVPKFKRNHRWTCGAVSSELPWVEVSRLFLDHGTRVEVSRTTFFCRNVLRPVPKCRRVSWCRSVLWSKCPVTWYGRS